MSEPAGTSDPLASPGGRGPRCPWPLEHLRRETFLKGEYLFRKGDSSDRIYYVESGVLSLVELHKTVEEGEFVGELGLFTKQRRRTASALCVTDLEAYSMGRDELARLCSSDPSLAIDLVQTSVQRCVDNLEEETRARERVESELRIAGDIQASLLPGEFPPFPDRKEIEIHATMEPARQVGGDYYDFFFIDSRRLCLTVGDVSDKGVPAALFMAMCKTLLKSKAWRGLPCQQIVEETNDDLHADNRACMFVTLVFAVLDVETGELQLCNCGHLAPLRLSSRGLEALSGPGGPMLGVMEGTRYPSASIRLEPGDLLFLYTDGLPDAQDPAGQSYSDRRMKELLRGLTNRSPGELVREVEAAFRAFRGDRPAFDDITMLALRYWGPAGPASQEPESPVRGAPGGDPRPPRPR